MTFTNPTDSVISEILKNAKTIAIVGLSNQPDRASFQVAAYLQAQGYRIVPINPNVDEVLGEKAVASLTELHHPVDIIDVFRRSDVLTQVAEAAAQLEAPVIWAQLGIYHETAANIAHKAGKFMIMDRCIKVDHHRLLS